MNQQPAKVGDRIRISADAPIDLGLWVGPGDGGVIVEVCEDENDYAVRMDDLPEEGLEYYMPRESFEVI